MNEPYSKWQTKELTQTFLEGVRGSLPGAELQLEVIGKIAQLWCDKPSAFLDLGCGNGILGRFLKEQFPSVHGVFVDFSEPMLEAARKNLHNIPQTTILKADFSEPKWIDRVQSHGPFDIIVSGFAIHHQPDHRKRTLYSEIFHILTPGGVFLNLEHVASATEAVTQLFDDFSIDNLYKFHKKSNPDVTREEIASTYYNRPDKEENILSSVERQCQWLRDIGFIDVDCFFKIFELAIFGGRKHSAG